MRLKPPCLGLALAALLAFPLAAEEARKEPPGKPATPAAEAALKVYVDPATGQLVPTADPSTKAALAPAPAAGLPVLKVEKGTTKAGGKRIRLDDRFQMQVTAKAAPDGKITQDCAAEHEKAAAPAKEHRHDR